MTIRPAGEAERRSWWRRPSGRPGRRPKALTKRTDEGEPVHSFQSLLRHLRTIVKNRIRLKSDAAIEFDKLTTPTPLQQRALDRLGSPHAVARNAPTPKQAFLKRITAIPSWRRGNFGLGRRLAGGACV